MILKNCRLVPELCEGFEAEMADIRIEGTDIAEILPAGGNYAGEEVIDCSGKTVLPGLHNLHVHLWFFKWDDDRQRAEASEYDMTMHSIHQMYSLLSYGYTSLRDVGSPYNIAINLKKSINAGRLLGPNLKASGYILTPYQIVPTILHCYSGDYGMLMNDPYQVRAVARKTLTDGADFLKILGSSVQPGKRGNGPLLYPDELQALQEVADREGTYIAVHTTTPESNQVAIDMDNYTIEHGLLLSKENIDTIVSRGFKSNLVATASICAPYGGEDAVRFSCAGYRDAHDAGVLIGWGTDATEEMFLNYPQQEFVLRSEVLGFSKMDVLKQATINSAKINGDGEIRGTVKVGKRADLAIFDGKPDEDFNVFGKPCALVIKDGVVVAQQGMVKLGYQL